MPRWCPPIGRRIGSPSLRHLHYPAVAPGPAVSYQSFGAASVLGGSTPSRGPRGAGAHGYPGTPDRRLFGAWPNCRPCAECSPPKFIGGLSRTAMSVTLALVPCPRYGVSASLWCRAFRFWAVIPPRRRGSRRPVLAQTAATLQVSTPPGFWAVLQENGLEFDALPGFWAVISVPRRDSRRCLRYNPRSEAFTSSAPRSAAYETAQNFARALANAQVPLHAAGLRNRPELCLAFQATNQSVGQAVRETAQNLARALCRTSDRAKNGVMGLRNRPELCSCVRPPSAG